MLRMALIAMLVAGVPALGIADVSAAAAKTKTEKSGKRNGEKKSTRKNKDRGTKTSKAKSGRDDTHTKKKPKDKPTTVATTVRRFNHNVSKIARRGTDWISPYVRTRHVKHSYVKRKYRAPVRSRYHRRKCTAAAKKRFGKGRRLWGISAHRYGARACRKALTRCRSKLRRHKSRGRNPNARCVVTYRG